ncbi:dual specificity mitogen-activated protein kinase kinase 7-like [Cylas formicarius]|uniref:dual specificity mitogen-activated protein kinase kinase 7-like n=1 Tax=Cylas formicarius TaxID=197179 RepID=UPI0029586781|nr:dual specificity mitogen-activated protein kinase kinase 7-like [Cylas formicarius]
MSNTQQKIDALFERLPASPPTNHRGSRPALQLGLNSSPTMQRPQHLTFATRRNENLETERRLKEIMQISGHLTIDGVLYKTDIKDMEHMEELGSGTCGHVVKMRHRPSGKTIAVKQMRRSGNNDESKRIIMDIEVVVKSHCKYIVKCLGCFITEAEVWICMELMDTCFDKLLKRIKRPVPEKVLGKVCVATVEALSYLKDQHNVIHRDVKPSNILLDARGNVKLCDFGISGRLVDSMAKSRSAGCAAYMAPERIEPDPRNPDYDVRADVWSLGITLVELATGAFPYPGCKTDFEVLTKVIGTDPPSLPKDKHFSPEFRDFVACCLTKDKERRPKYAKLKSHAFVKRSETAPVDVGEWYERTTAATEDAPASNAAASPTPRLAQPLESGRLPVNSLGGDAFRQRATPPPAVNGGGDGFARKGGDAQARASRLDAFHAAAQQQQQEAGKPSGRGGGFSLLQAYENHIASLRRKDEAVASRGYPAAICSPLPRRKFATDVSVPPVQLKARASSETRWTSEYGSPLPLRSSHFQTEEPASYCGNTSPVILQRFYHQRKQQQLLKEAEEERAKTDVGKKRFASYIKMQLTGGDRSGRSSRHQSPEPPPRLSRGGDGQSPLALRRAFLESHAPNSPSLSRRYVSPSPPVPPPRCLSQSCSVPGSPQHLRARFRYTPEPQRRFVHDNDS